MPETQRCAACKRPLSRYNPDPLCGPCLRAARHGPDAAEIPADGGGLTPVWLWDSPPMRRALSRPDPGAMLVIFRAATGLSQLEIGDIMGWCAHLARDGRAGLARQAIQLSDRAKQLARRDPTPKLHALIAAREATAWAALGDVCGFRTALSRSWRELDRGDTSDEPAWLNFVRPAEITAHEAKGRASLGDTGRAADLYRQSLNAQDVSRRNRACYHTRLASALADCGAVTDAINEGLAVLPVLEGPVSSPRALRELRPVRIAAERHGNEEFCARFDAVCDAEAI